MEVFLKGARSIQTVLVATLLSKQPVFSKQVFSSRNGPKH